MVLLNQSKKRNGFTLIELIIVLAVLGVIAIIAVPKYLGIQEQTRIDADYSTAASIAKAAEIYYAENDLSIPSISYSSLVADEIIEPDIKLQSNMFGQANLSDSNVAIVITPDLGNVVTFKIDGVTLYPKP